MNNKNTIVVCHISAVWWFFILLLNFRTLLWRLSNIGYLITLPTANPGAFTTIIFNALIQLLKSNIFIFVCKTVKILIFRRFGPTYRILKTLSRLLNLRHLKLGSPFIMQVKILLLNITLQLFLAPVKLIEYVKSTMPKLFEGICTIGTFKHLNVFWGLRQLRICGRDYRGNDVSNRIIRSGI